MGLYLYCLGPSSHPEPPPLTGLEGAPVRAEGVAGFTAWLSDLERAPDPSLDRVRVHNAVVEAANERATPLPLRFGQWFATREEMEASLEARRESLASGLARVEGTLEYGVRVLDPRHRPAELERTTGTAYLEALARRAQGAERDRARGEEVAAALRAWLGPLVREDRVRLVGGETLAAIAYLVHRHDTGTYTTRVSSFPPERPDLRFLFSGPWPPYGFVA